MVVLITVTATDDNYVDDLAGTINNLQHYATVVLMPSLQCSEPQAINSS
jgi:hypothetical protein